MGRGMKGAMNGALTFPANKANHTPPRALKGQSPGSGEQGSFHNHPCWQFDGMWFLMPSEHILFLTKLSNSSVHKIHHVGRAAVSDTHPSNVNRKVRLVESKTYHNIGSGYKIRSLFRKLDSVSHKLQVKIRLRGWFFSTLELGVEAEQFFDGWQKSLFFMGPASTPGCF